MRKIVYNPSGNGELLNDSTVDCPGLPGYTAVQLTFYQLTTTTTIVSSLQMA